jgi:hypothetical protein
MNLPKKVDLLWNKEEQETAKEMAINMGCDKFRLITEATNPRLKYRQQNYTRKHNCLWTDDRYLFSAHEPKNLVT